MYKGYKKFFFVFVLLFLFIVPVEAEEITTQDGYARCVYGGTISSTKNRDEWKAAVSIVIRIYRDTDGVVRSYANMSCTKGYTASNSIISDYFDCSISNYNDLFHNASTELMAYYRHNSWYCNPQIYVKLNDIENPTSASISMTPQSGYTKVSLSSDYSSTSDSAVTFDSDDDTSDDFATIRSEAWEEHVEDQEELAEQVTGVSDTSDGSIIEKIIAWGGTTLGLDYDLSSNSCSLITDGVRDFLHDVFFYMSIIGIVILVIMTGINVVKVITASEDDALKGFLKNLWKRIVCLIILLLLPMLVTFIIQVVNGVATIWGVNSDDPLCSITE